MVKVLPPNSPGAPGPVSNRTERSSLPPGSPDGVLVAPFRVIADLRERAAGWRFVGQSVVKKKQRLSLLVPLEHRHMKTADYTIDGAPCFIERKSHEDAIGSIGGGHENFRREHERMLQIVEDGGFCCVIVESSLDAILCELEDEFSARNLNPETVLAVAASWPQRYRVPWYFAGSRAAAERLALRVLWKFWDRQQERTAGHD
jgi:ERCC4-type nuclease